MIKIISDSTCDLSPELVERYAIEILPLYVRLGEKEYRDGVNITPEEIFAWSDRTGETPKTSAPSQEDILDVFRRELDRGNELIVFTISSQMSASFNNCRLAADILHAEDRIRVIDSENLSTGIGLLVVEAAEMAAAGKSLEEIEKAILALRPRVRASFTVDTLRFLARGGRCSGAAALLGGILQLHPRIEVADGAMRPGKKYRGRPSRYIMDYVQDMEAAIKAAKPDRVFITHSGCPQDIVQMVRDWLVKLGVFTEILETRAGGVVSSHCGPGTLGVLFIAGE